MCGIAGIFHFASNEPVPENVLRRMNECLVHRGPDESGISVDGPVGLAMRRLAIIDLKSGQQPLANEDGAVSVVFNGEIYNFQDLRQELEAKGHRFKTKSDTEVLVH